MLTRIAILCWLTVLTMLGQKPAFDVASVKVVKLAAHPVFGNIGGPGTSDPGRVHLCCVGMFSLIMRAYDIEIDRIAGPAWIMENTGPDLYQVDATMPPGTTKAQYQLMLQQLLQERFHLAIHFEKRSFRGYALGVAVGGPKMKESKTDPNFVAGDSPAPKRASNGMVILPPGPQMFTSLGLGVIIVQAQQKPISDLVKAMGRMINQSMGENPNDYSSPKARVIDQTGLTGVYDFTLHFSCELCQFAAVNGAVGPPATLQADSPNGEPSLFVALQKQLGLKLTKIKEIPLDIVIVDHVDKTPTAN